ncbi:protein [Lentinula edodes]|uniref:Protein n=1 Tax=Lentinula edodes TaxID=5353 RepID=A0A1Q3DW69_LENED|nr:protein [Lentinula edodes]
MATIVTPFDKMFLTSIWIETLLYGLNCAVFGTAMYVLIRKQSRNSNWFLIPVSIFLFSLSTGYVAVSFRQLLNAFIFAPPGGASAYFKIQTNPLAVTKLVLYSTNVTAQNLFLIWRLWGVWNRRWWVVVLPISNFSFFIIEKARHGDRAYSVRIYRNRRRRSPTIVNWCMDLAINICVTAAIAFRLWQMARTVGPSMPGHRQFLGIMRMILESGLLFATATLITVSIYLSGSLDTVNAIDGIVQLATITPLLIIVRVGLGLTAGQQSRDTEVDVPSKLEFITRSRLGASTNDDSEITDSTHVRTRPGAGMSDFDLHKVEESSV